MSFPCNMHGSRPRSSPQRSSAPSLLSRPQLRVTKLTWHPQPPPAPPIPPHRWSLLPSPATPPETKLQKLLLPAPAQSPRGSHQQESRHPQHRGLAPHSHTNTPPLNSHHHHCPPLPNTSQLGQVLTLLSRCAHICPPATSHSPTAVAQPACASCAGA